ncbi:MAG: 3-dehydroquinate dehydratase [Bacteroidales bacterium]|nr:3-dehydroquinate dehydratase [Bacteroidales bacterium]
MKIAIINGANLNLLSIREPNIYGKKSMHEINEEIMKFFPDIEFHFFHSNIEGELVNALHKYSEFCNGIVINPGGYSHYSVVLHDAIKAINIPVVEVHLSNIFGRESYRKSSITGSACIGIITGFGIYSYILGVKALLLINKSNK